MFTRNAIGPEKARQTGWRRAIPLAVAEIAFVAGVLLSSQAYGQQTLRWMIFFDWKRSEVSAQAFATLRQVVDAYRQVPNATRSIDLVGNSDTSLSDTEAVKIGFERANAVKDALVKLGFPANQIFVTSRGKRSLLVQTADGVKEPQNRRVEITLK